MIASAAAWVAAPALSQVPEWSLRAQQRLRGNDPEARAALLVEGERLLAAHDAVAAEAAFDRAALMLHAADTEIALVRTYLQQGQYRRALAFCAHAAGVHRDVVAAAALYVWLLDAGGQAAVAHQKLGEAEALYPGEALLAALRAQLSARPPRAEGPLRELPARLAPYAPALDEPVRVAGAAVLGADGRAALTLASMVQGATRVWLRNGLGETVPVGVPARQLPEGLVLLEPAQPWPALPALAAAPRDPFAGRPGFVIGHGVRADGDTDWPWLRMGFLGGTLRQGPQRRLGIPLPGAEAGALVLDEAGRLAGIGLGGGAWLPASALRDAWPPGPGPEAADRVAPDAAYERGLRLSLQVLVPREPVRS